jgi:hypothetical protein
MKLILTGLTCLLITSCATSGARLTAVQLPGNEIIYKEGKSVGVSRKDNSVVIAGPESGAEGTGNRQIFVIGVKNTGTEPVTIGLSNARMSTNTGDTINTVPVAQLEKSLKRWSALAGFTNGFADTVGAVSAAQSGYETKTARYTSNGTYSGTASLLNSYRSNQITTQGTYASNGTIQYREYNQEKVDRAMAASAQATTQRANEANDGLAQLKEQIFYTQTVMPGFQYISKITFEAIPADAKQVNLILTVGKETHRFSWDQIAN